MTRDEFEAFLARLGSDRERAGELYEQIRCKLVTFFRGRGVTDAEHAADEVFDRVARRVLAGGVQEVVWFTWGVARKVASEFGGNKREVPLNEAEGPPINPTHDDEDQLAEIRYWCLYSALGLLEPHQRDLLLAWYLYDKYDKGKKIDNRKRLAAQRLTTVATLKGRVHRLRARVREHVEECTMRSSVAAAV